MITSESDEHKEKCQQAFVCRTFPLKKQPTDVSFAMEQSERVLLIPRCELMSLMTKKMVHVADSITPSLSWQEGRTFTFVVGTEKRQYEYHLIVACLMSEKVHRVLMNDPTATSLRVLPNESCVGFDDFVEIWNGKSIAITESNGIFLIHLCQDIECEYLRLVLERCADSCESLSRENVIVRFLIKTQYEWNTDAEIKIIASEFSSFSVSDLVPLGVESLDRILSHEELQISSENALLGFICEFMTHDKSGASLLRYIHFNCLDSSHKDLFLNSIPHEIIDATLLQSITQYIGQLKSQIPATLSDSDSFPYDNANPFNGIISHLRDACGGNPHEKGIIVITGSSNAYNKCHQIVNYGWKDYWHTVNEPNSWFQFDFKDRRVLLESYILRSNGNGGNYLRSWKIEGSNDASSWTELDTKNGSHGLQGDFYAKHYLCSRAERTFFRYIRLTQTGKNSHKGDYLLLSEVELFGRMK